MCTNKTNRRGWRKIIKVKFTTTGLVAFLDPSWFMTRSYCHLSIRNRPKVIRDSEKRLAAAYRLSGAFLEGKSETLLSSLFPLFFPGALNEKRNCEAERNQKRLREIERAHRQGTEMHPGQQVA